MYPDSVANSLMSQYIHGNSGKFTEMTKGLQESNERQWLYTECNHYRPLALNEITETIPHKLR